MKKNPPLTSSATHACNSGSGEREMLKRPDTLRCCDFSILTFSKTILSYERDVRRNSSTFFTWPVRSASFAFSTSLPTLSIEWCFPCLPGIPLITGRFFFKEAANTTMAPRACANESPCLISSECVARRCPSAESLPSQTSFHMSVKCFSPRRAER